MTRAAIAGIAVVALAAVLFSLNRIDDIALAPEGGGERLPRYTLSEAELVRYDTDGQPALKARAATLEYYDDESANATTLVVDVLAGPKTPWHLEAPSGRIEPGSRELILDGAVIATGQWPDNGEALVLRTPRLNVDPERHLLHTKAPIEAVSRTRNGTAVGMTADWVAQDLRLLNKVKMRHDVTR